MSAHELDKQGMSRRNMLAASAAMLAGGAAAGVAATAATALAGPEMPEGAPPLPWKWVTLDPLEAGQRAYRFYLEKDGCGTASYLSLLSLLKEKVGYPWTTLPDMMMSHAAAGYAGHGTLCGALGGAACIINLVAYDPKDPAFRQIIDRLFYWYAEQDFPTNRFDDISEFPNQVKAKAMSPLCHTSVSKWAMTAGAKISSEEKKARCAKVAGEVVYMVTQAFNEYFAGTWVPPVWKPSEEIEHCVKCHGPDDASHSRPSKFNQQGHMECLMCHDDHMA